MSGCCSQEACTTNQTTKVDPTWRRALWFALVVNAGMFAAEVAAGLAAHSSSLQADSLDFLSDAANYAISLGVAGLTLAVRARAAWLKGATLLALGLWIIGAVLWRMWVGDAAPQAMTMGAVGGVALAANAGVALVLYRFRQGDANMRSVWICSRNDAIGNIAVMLAAVGVFGTGTIWPDLVVATVMGALSISGGVTIVRQAAGELRQTSGSLVAE